MPQATLKKTLKFQQDSWRGQFFTGLYRGGVGWLIECMYLFCLSVSGVKGGTFCDTPTPSHAPLIRALLHGFFFLFLSQVQPGLYHTAKTKNHVLRRLFSGARTVVSYFGSGYAAPETKLPFFNNMLCTYNRVPSSLGKLVVL